MFVKSNETHCINASLIKHRFITLNRQKSYRFDEQIQIIHFKSVWIHVVQVLKLLEESLVVHRYVFTSSQ